jgi:hypothetical protein
LAISSTTGNAVFSGSVTGSSIIGGTLNISGNAIINSSGLLTATGATITGTINAEDGYFGSPSNGFSISATGLVGVGSGIIIGGTIATAASGQRITLNAGSDNSIKIHPDSSSQPGYISATSVSGQGALRINGPFTSGWNNSNIQLYSLTSTTSYIQLTGDVVLVNGGFSVTQGSLFSGNATFSSNATFNGYIYYPGYQVSTSGGTARVNDGSTPTARLVAASGSSIRFKKDVVDISTVSVLNPKLLLQVPVKAFKYREDYLDAEDERSDVLVPGFIAEELDAIYPVAVDHDAQGRASRWSSDFIVPGMLALIQDLYKEIDQLKGE